MVTKADSTKAATATDTEAAAKAKAVDKAKRDAASTLVKSNQDQFNQMVKDDLASQGIEWSPRRTAEEKAADEFALLLQQYPALAQQIPSQVA